MSALATTPADNYLNKIISLQTKLNNKLGANID